MRRTLLATAFALLAFAAPAQAQDIAEQLEAIPGMTVVEEKTAPAPYRYFVLNYTQPNDHLKPFRGSFQQRLTVLHRGTDRPTVLHTSGYNVGTNPTRSEPTRLVDGNQVSTEQRFFTPSRPQPADWTRQLTIWQAASDHHRIVSALDGLYRGKWLSTGASKGGMTSVYHRRFFPRDVDGTVAYVAPNDVVNHEDSRYTRFFETVGTPGVPGGADRARARGARPAPRRAAHPLPGRRDRRGLDVLEHAADDRPRARDGRARHGVGVLAVQRRRELPGHPAGDRDDRGDLRVPGRRPCRLRLLHRPGPGAVHPVLLPGRRRSSATRCRASRRLDGLTRYRGLYQPRAVVPRELKMRFEPQRMRDIDQLGPQAAAASCCSSTARTTRGAPRRSSSATAPATRTGTRRRAPTTARTSRGSPCPSRPRRPPRCSAGPASPRRARHGPRRSRGASAASTATRRWSGVPRRERRASPPSGRACAPGRRRARPASRRRRASGCPGSAARRA